MKETNIEDSICADSDSRNSVLYRIEVAKNLGEPFVVVSFFGFNSDEETQSFAEYMRTFLELNEAESPSGLIN